MAHWIRKLLARFRRREALRRAKPASTEQLVEQFAEVAGARRVAPRAAAASAHYSPAPTSLEPLPLLHPLHPLTPVLFAASNDLKEPCDGAAPRAPSSSIESPTSSSHDASESSTYEYPSCDSSSSSSGGDW